MMAGDRTGDVAARDPATLRFGILQHVAMDALDPEVATAFDASIKALGKAGVVICEVAFSDLVELPKLNARGGIAAAEAMDVHAGMLERQLQGEQAAGGESDQRYLGKLRGQFAVGAFDVIEPLLPGR